MSIGAKSWSPPNSAEDCLIAAEQVQRKLMALCRKIEETEDPNAMPRNPLPVDLFLDGMVKTALSPRIVFEPPDHLRPLYTKSSKAYVYARIEAAFVKAGRVSGGSRVGYVKELQQLKAWVRRQAKQPNRPIPMYFTQRTARLICEGFWKDDHRERLSVVMRLGTDLPSCTDDLVQLEQWIEDDLADKRLKKKGRPPDYQKVIFAVEMANLWGQLTGQRISTNPDTCFERFLVACWQSGLAEMNANSSFKRVLLHRIEERTEPCGRCKKCSENMECDQIRYFGRLF